MPLCRLLPAGLLAVLLPASCFPEPVLHLVDCKAVWSCGDQESAEDDDGDEDLCLDENDTDRQATIDSQVAELQTDCNAIPVNCVGGEAAVCVASCTPTTAACAPDAGS